MNHVTHPLSSADISIFYTRNLQIFLYQEIQIQIPFGYIISTISNFSESLRIVLINMVTILAMSAKMATPGLLRIKVFWKNGFDVIISVHDLTNKILSRDSNYNVNVAMWSKFGNSSNSAREVIMTSIL